MALYYFPVIKKNSKYQKAHVVVNSKQVFVNFVAMTRPVKELFLKVTCKLIFSYLKYLLIILFLFIFAKITFSGNPNYIRNTFSLPENLSTACPLGLSNDGQVNIFLELG